jgi:perosamine synthetase
MSKFIPYGRQSITDGDLADVRAALESDFLTSGPRVAEFESAVARLVGAKHAVAVNSATSALHLAVKVLGISRKDRVVTSPNTFVASANCAAFEGATPDFVDIDPDFYCLDPKQLVQGWKSDTKVVIPVDFAGHPADLVSIAEVARSRGAYVIDDASHAFGGGFTYGGKVWRHGANPWADITVFSFHPVKTMTTGEGGMLVTDRDDWAEAARSLRSHGIRRENFSGLGATGDPALDEKGSWYYEMHELGYNYRLTDLQCALGLSQLKRLPEFLVRRRQIVATYNRAFSGLNWLKVPSVRVSADVDHVSWHLYVVQLDFFRIGRSRSEVMLELKRQGVGSQVLYIPVHLQPWYRRTFRYTAGKCPYAEDYYKRALSLPLFPAMTDDDVRTVIEAVLRLAPG